MITDGDGGQFWGGAVNRRETLAAHLGGSRWCLEWWSLELEWLRVHWLVECRLGHSNSATRCEGRCLLDVIERFVCCWWEARRHGVLGESRRLGAVLREGWGLGAESRSVGCGLAAELGKVEVGASLVSHIHGLGELSLGVVTVKDDTVKDDADDLNDNLDNHTDQRPVLFVS